MVVGRQPKSPAAFTPGEIPGAHSEMYLYKNIRAQFSFHNGKCFPQAGHAYRIRGLQLNQKKLT